MRPDFNPGQMEAVASRAGRIVVSAGAGSGKTRVLVQRFVDRVLEEEAAGRSAPVRSVLLITFTDKAAGELAERVRRAFLDGNRPDLAREVDNAWISTIHGFCARIVRRHALELGVDPAFAVLADPRTGLAQTEAFERAASGLLRTSDRAGILAEMVEEGLADLRQTVLSGFDRARSKGAAVRDVRPPVDRGYRHQLAALARSLDTVTRDYASLGGTATIAANLQGYARARAAVPEIEAASGLEGARMAAALGVFKGACIGGQEMKTATREINAAIDAVAQAATDTLAAMRAEAWIELLVAFSDEYEQDKAAAGVLDFEDLQLLVRRLWTDHPSITEAVGASFAEVMVDEFQDTNQLQLQVIEPISGATQCVVGDVQQSIYRFRDADVTVLEGKRSHAEVRDGHQACRLTVNYRSDGRLLEALNTVFGTPSFFGSEYLTLASGAVPDSAHDLWDDVPRVQVLIVDKARCPDKDWRSVEARALAQRLRALVDHDHVAPGDIVVLVRASTTMSAYTQALRDVGLDVLAASAGGFYAAPEYADSRALLRVLTNPLDDEGLLCLLAGGFGGLSDDALLALSIRRGDGRLWDALGEAEAAGLSGRDLRLARAVTGTIGELRGDSGRVPLADALLHAARVLGTEAGLLARPGSWANVRKVARLAAEFENDHSGDPAAFLRHLDARETFVRREPEAAVAAEGSNAVRVMTVHAAKGLEFPVVAVADLGHGPVNTRASVLLDADGQGGLVAAARGPRTVEGVKAGASTAWTEAVEREKGLDLEESKRVFYVACTRAEKMLLLAGSTDPASDPKPDIAADWVLRTVRDGQESLKGLIALDIIGADDVPELGPVPRTSDGDGADAACAPIARLLGSTGPISPPEEISYTALSLYEHCSYRFFAERMLRIGSVQPPRVDDPLQFGSALHAALQLVARGAVMDEERVRTIAGSFRLTADGLERLRSALRSVRESDVWPLVLAGSPEVPFAIRVGGRVVRGTMDLVLTGSDEATVLDYKTGTTWDPTGAEYEAQAEIYALALLDSGVSSVRMLFVHVEAGCEKAEYRFSGADRSRVVGRIERAFESMEAGEFPSLTAYEPRLCADCPVSGGLCPVVHPHKRGSRR